MVSTGERARAADLHGQTQPTTGGADSGPGSRAAGSTCLPTTHLDLLERDRRAVEAREGAEHLGELTLADALVHLQALERAVLDARVHVRREPAHAVRLAPCPARSSGHRNREHDTRDVCKLRF